MNPLGILRQSSFEENMSILVCAVGNLEKIPPRSADDLHRVRLLVSRIDTATTRATRAIELMETTNV